eukprot:350001-Chlamydomonas_euryale.AAC.7
MSSYACKSHLRRLLLCDDGGAALSHPAQPPRPQWAAHERGRIADDNHAAARAREGNVETPAAMEKGGLRRLQRRKKGG